MAHNNVTEFKKRCEPIEERIYDFGEYRIGTKEQLQAIGIGVGKAFPGEPGAQPRQITVLDSRGWKVQITRDCNYSNGERNWTGRYKAYAKTPPEVRAEREAPARRTAQIRAAAHRISEKGSAAGKAYLAAMRIEELEFRPEGVDNFSSSQFREFVARNLTRCNSFLNDALKPSCESKYFLNESTVAQIKKQLEIVEEIIFSAPLNCDADAQKNAILEDYELLGLEPPAHLGLHVKPALYLVK